jgi:hypothetical protein
MQRISFCSTSRTGIRVIVAGTPAQSPQVRSLGIVALLAVATLAPASRAMAQADDVTASQAATAPNPGKAGKRSLLYTLVPLPTLVLAIPALIVGPSTGYFYGGMKGRAWSGIGVRTLAFGGMIAAVGACYNYCSDGSQLAAGLAFFAAGGLLLGSAIYDMASVKKAVRNHNQRPHEKPFAVYPTYFPSVKAVGIVFSRRI